MGRGIHILHTHALGDIMDETQPKIVTPFPATAIDKPEPSYSEDQIALEFADKYKELIRYEGYRNRWFKWAGTRWEVDYNLSAHQLVRKLCRDVAIKLNDEAIGRAINSLPSGATKEEKDKVRRNARKSNSNISRQLRSARTIFAILNLSRSDPKLSSTVKQWDANEWVLNTPNGTVDLRTGQMRKHSIRDYITKTASVSPAHGTPKRWLEFLNEIFQGDKEVIDYIQRVLGYCITGATTDHALFYAWGRGQNGKTTILETVGHILGDYWIESPPQAFIAGGEARHETEIARMHNVRLVTSDELPQGKEWDTSKVKRLTGGSTISARFMRQDYFEFEPQFKLLMAGNDRPSIRQVDDAIRRRFHLIPFTFKIPEEKKDKDLPLKLQAEAPLILGWIIEGCLQWQRLGLAPPKVVSSATDDYLTSEDSLATWFDECCVADVEAMSSTTELYQSWLSWCRTNEEHPGSRKGFSQQLSNRAPIFNITKFKGRDANGFKGVHIRVPGAPVQANRSAPGRSGGSGGIGKPPE